MISGQSEVSIFSPLDFTIGSGIYQINGCLKAFATTRGLKPPVRICTLPRRLIYLYYNKKNVVVNRFKLTYNVNYATYYSTNT